MTYAIKPKGYIRVLRPNGTQVSQHDTLDKAIVAALNQPPNVEYTLNLPDYTVKNTTAVPPPPPPPANENPVVALTSPANGAQFDAPATIAITAAASDDGSVAKVEFFMDGASVSIATSAPYSAQALAVPAGDHVLTARATDNVGAQTTSAARTVQVRAVPPPPPPPVTGTPNLPALAADPITGTVAPIALGANYID